MNMIPLRKSRIEELKKFFGIENDDELFLQAITPPSCGGGKGFKSLALKGDNKLNTYLNILFQKKGIIDSGLITKHRQGFHNERTLTALGRLIHVDELMNPNNNLLVTENDIKEAIEALIGASSMQNSEEFMEDLVNRLYNLALEENLIDFDPISTLQILIQKDPDHVVPTYETYRLGGPDHNPIWVSEVKFQYMGQIHNFKGDEYNNKKVCNRSAAFNALKALDFVSDGLLESPSQPISTEQSVSIPQSLDEREILFSKSEKKESDIKIKVGTGEKLIDYARRKMEKNPFGFLMLLSARLPEISGSTWKAEISTGKLIILTLNIGEKIFFDIGFASSNSKARKVAALKIIEQSNLFDWLEENHGQDII